jgi:hypothetical protein
MVLDILAAIREVPNEREIEKKPQPESVPLATKIKRAIFPSEKRECLRRIGNILADHKGLESNIPINHSYWELMNHYRSLPNDEK